MDINTISAYVWDTLEAAVSVWGSGSLQNWTGYPAVSPDQLPADKMFVAVGMSRVFSGTSPFDIIDVNVPVYVVYTATTARDVNDLVVNIYSTFGKQVDSIGSRLYVETGLNFYDEQLKMHIQEINIVASVFGI